MKFELVRLGDYFSLEKGASYTSANLVDESDVGLLTINAFTLGGGYKPNSEKPFSGPVKDQYILAEGDVLIATTEQDAGLLASPLVVKIDQTNFKSLLYSLDVAKVLTRSDAFLPRFLFNVLRIPAFRKRAAYGDTGSTVQRLPYEALYDLKIPKPPLRVQEAIIRLIDSIDEKIRTNQQTASDLENIAQTIFKSWFLDFDPVKAKMAGEQPLGMNSEIASLFPDAMEDSEGEKIPAGWKQGVVSDLCDSVVNGSTPLRSNSEFWNQADLPWFKTGELSDNFLFDSKESITSLALKRTSVKTLPRGSVLMAIYAAPTVGRLGILTKDSTFNQACTGMVPKVEFGTAYLYLTLFNRRVWFNSLAIGAAQQNISKGVVENCPAILAPASVHEAFRSITEPIFAQVEVLSAQSIYLARVRDSLLPRLVSGDLQVPEEMLAS